MYNFYRHKSILSALAAVFLIVFLAGAAAAQNSSTQFANVDAAINQAIQDNQIPGAVLVIGHDGKVVYRKAYGERSLEPTREPMTIDTVFDMASITKCMVTANAVMQLVEEGKIRLNDTVAKYIPEFAKNGKQDITIRQLATHYSGLAPDLDLKQPWTGKDTAYQMADDETPVSPPGTSFVYSDINYIVLGELVERVSGMPLEEYAQEKIFGPLGMKDTRFLPPADWLPRIAPTEYDENHNMLRGVVHDPTARRMGGVAGHAGLFSTGDDVAHFAQAMLDQLADPNNVAKEFVISTAGLEKMTTPEQPPTGTSLRGIGWDIDSPFASNRGELLPVGGFGHTGFTGTSIWVDPTTDTYIVLLINAVHPNLRPGAPAVALRTKVSSAVAADLRLTVSESEKRRMLSLTGYNEAMVGERRLQARNGQVKTGIDRVEEWGNLFGPGSNASCDDHPCRVGLVTNQTGLDSEGRRTIDVLAHLDGVKLVAIFSPEHGIAGKLDTTEIGNTRDAATGVPVYSVYGAKEDQRRPSLDVLKTLDRVVFDMQDAGVRWYTYETTLGYFLEACAKVNVPMTVLDRPNPITGSFVQGLVSDPGKESFVNYSSVPVRHGMTVGELAKMFNEERGIHAQLTVVPVEGWLRGDWFDSTGLTWTNPSPNLRSLTEATLYPGVALVEGTNVSVGRGTDTPFELMGAPWIDARLLSAYLNARKLAGIRFMPTDFTPNSPDSWIPYNHELCHGVSMIVIDRNALDSPELGLELASALMKLYPDQYKPERMPHLLVNEAAFEALKAGEDPRRIEADGQDALSAFEMIRAKYLLY